MCLSAGFPSIAECEWALLGTRKANDAGKPLVLDLWHTKCVRCPEALTKLDGIAGSGKHPGVVFAACALSLCDKPDPPKSEEAGREAVIELVDDMWDNLKHCYMTAEEKVNPALP